MGLAIEFLDPSLKIYHRNGQLPFSGAVWPDPIDQRSDSIHLSDVPATENTRPFYFRDIYEDPVRVTPPTTSISGSVPRKLVSHLMRNKKDSALGEKFATDSKIINLEEATHTVGGTYEVDGMKEVQGAMLVMQNKSDAFGQNIETEGMPSLDGAIDKNSSASATLKIDRTDLLLYVI
ncbi:hypothetical protein B2J93_4494 [Marssonina coronariae]|uniref:Uncharacterized protein n=1 Tax=Diplocarpon coronariae TaxID=2795749 RepID=A0A218YSD9_9HELO|nr:hypothetical protein B2J93_4494 [Marssonina coronariae]